MGTQIVQNPDGSVSLRGDADAIDHIRVGGPTTPSAANPRWSNEKTVKVPLTAGSSAGGVLAWQNPESVAILITGLVVDVTTKSTGAGTASFGTAANGTTSSANLIDTLDVGTAAGTFDNNTDKGTLGKTRQRLATGSYVTGSQATGAVAGLVGNAYITYIPV
ncbi:MAG: hypothetical protein QOK29_2983 [Rhodospirillaceae bacterium]|jgi:hypothetical protein|nr:hypothetical protein [Rhodospirillaceae bacterium]